ncbi:hypothetical protein CC56_1020 [Bordetella pertussis H934]|nr:hypothetical protein CC56_1020 [Bordetella pertussis H934]
MAGHQHRDGKGNGHGGHHGTPGCGGPAQRLGRPPPPPCKRRASSSSHGARQHPGRRRPPCTAWPPILVKTLAPAPSWCSAQARPACR